MNIFYLSRDPATCARWHNDRHVQQMMREYPHLLSIAHRVLDGTHRVVEGRDVWVHADPRMDRELYRVARLAENVCSLWTMHSRENYLWLYQLFEALAAEYRYRFHADHVNWTRLGTMLAAPPAAIQRAGWTHPYPAMHPRYEIGQSSLQSYRECYRWGKQPLAVWTGREPPPWYMIEGMEVWEDRPGKTGQRRLRVTHPGCTYDHTPRGKTRGIRPDGLADGYNRDHMMTKSWGE